MYVHIHTYIRYVYTYTHTYIYIYIFIFFQWLVSQAFMHMSVISATACASHDKFTLDICHTINHLIKCLRITIDFCFNAQLSGNVVGHFNINTNEFSLVTHHKKGRVVLCMHGDAQDASLNNFINGVFLFRSGCLL